MGLLQNFISLILPPRCIKCGKVLDGHNGLCAECFGKIDFISAPMCYCCGRPFDSAAHIKYNAKQCCANCLKKKRHLFVMQRSAFIYNDESKNMILDLKFRDKTFAAPVLANMLFAAGRDIWEQKPDLIVPVPIHYLRMLKRRYNQSALLVKYLSPRAGVMADYTSLIRHENTIPQVQLSGEARRKNLTTAFMVKYPQNIKGKKIVLIDDVVTTGSTLNECAKVLRRAGAKAVYSITLARTEK